MDLAFEKSAHIGVGFAQHSDAFQCGREAAQMAKNQYRNGDSDLVIVFCSKGTPLKDYIEGVRLVTGEDRLVGIPVEWVLTNDIPAFGICVVLYIQLPTLYCSLQSTVDPGQNITSEITSLVNQHRQTYGLAHQTFPHRGILLFQNKAPDNLSHFIQEFLTTCNFEPWLMGCTPSLSMDKPMVCRQQQVQSGLIGIELFSKDPLGRGHVGLNSFAHQMDVYKEAAKSCIREALHRIQERSVAVSFLMLQLGTNTWSQDDFREIFKSAQSILHNTPLIMFPTFQQIAQDSQVSLSLHSPTLFSLVIPK